MSTYVISLNARQRRELAIGLTEVAPLYGFPTDEREDWAISLIIEASGVVEVDDPLEEEVNE